MIKEITEFEVPEYLQGERLKVNRGKYVEIPEGTNKIIIDDLPLKGGRKIGVFFKERNGNGDIIRGLGGTHVTNNEYKKFLRGMKLKRLSYNLSTGFKNYIRKLIYS